MISPEKYSVGLPDELKPYRKPLPFCYQSTSIETRFTNLMEPDARGRSVFAFHRPETLAKWLVDESKMPGSTLRARLMRLPPLIEERLWPAQIRAIRGLERSLSEGHPRGKVIRFDECESNGPVRHPATRVSSASSQSPCVT